MVADRHGQVWSLDNGQHILIGAYTACLGLMRHLGVAPESLLQRVPLALRAPDGTGLALPPAPPGHPRALPRARALWGLLRARGWRWPERWHAARSLGQWLQPGFRCPPDWTVAQLCAGLPGIVVESLLEPLCVAALNTPIEQASASVFLRVLRDALLGPAADGYAPSDLLLPRADLSRLLPDAAQAYLVARGHALILGARVTVLEPLRASAGWRVHVRSGQHWESEAVVLATPPWDSARLLQTLPNDSPHRCTAARWAACASALPHQAIATVYLRPPPGWRWPGTAPLLRLAPPHAAPAQFVFWREDPASGQGILAFVASAPKPELLQARGLLTTQVLAQARHALGIEGATLLQTVVEKRATFACTPWVERPPTRIAPGLVAAGDAIAGPYPATLEGAVRSGLAAVRALADE